MCIFKEKKEWSSPKELALKVFTQLLGSNIYKSKKWQVTLSGLLPLSTWQEHQRQSPTQ
jgi:hypothetical protein